MVGEATNFFSVRRDLLLRYGLAVLAVGLAFMLKLLLSRLIVQDTPFLLLFIPITVAAWYGGLGPGILATVLAALITDYFFLPPLGAYSGLGPGALPVAVFILEGALVSFLASALRRARRRAKGSEERFRLLVEGVEDYAIFMLDSDGRVASWNTGAERNTGYQAKEILGEHFSRFYTPEDIERGHPEEELRVAAAEGRYEEEGWRVRKDGSRFWSSVVITALKDEAGTLRGFAKVTRDVTERRLAEQRLRDTLNRLLVIYETGQRMGTSLNLQEIGASLLQNVQRIFDLSASVIELRDNQGEWSVLCATGSEDSLRRVRTAPESNEARRSAIETEEPRSFVVPGQDGENRLVGVCLPLLMRERLVGMLEAYGTQNLLDEQSMETLDSLGAQAASALENARLYEALAEREGQLHELVGKIMAAQEEERHRVAYDIHDGLAQMVVAAHAQLDSYVRHNALPEDADDRGRKKLDRATDIIDHAVREARRLIAGLRPTALDDLGLAAALRLEAEELRAEGYRVEYEEALGEEDGARLPSMVETTLFRVAQEALTNFKKHAQSHEVHLRLERLDGAVRLEVRDRGRGFEPNEGNGRGDHKGNSIGLSSMQQRVALVGGNFEVRSRPGEGTAIVAKVTLGEEGDVDRGR